MTGNEYQILAYRTCNPESFDRMLNVPEYCSSKEDFGHLMEACFGLAGETGELVDLVKKLVFHAKVEDNFVEHIKREAGDICWYLSLLCHSLGISFDDMMRTNIKKLEARYNGGEFDYSLANNKRNGDI